MAALPSSTTVTDRLIACSPCFETLAWLAPPAITAKPLRGHEVVCFNKLDLILRSGVFRRVSKDGRESVRCLHPSRRLLRKLLRMRSEIYSQPLRRPLRGRLEGWPQYRFVIPGTRFIAAAVGRAEMVR